MHSHEDNTRVFDKLAPAIIEFWRLKKSSENRQFHLQDLVDFIKAKGIVFAPNSPARIAQMLKNEEGKINYKVLKRSKSLYEARELHENGDEETCDSSVSVTDTLANTSKDTLTLQQG